MKESQILSGIIRQDRKNRSVINQNPNYRRILNEFVGYLIKLINDEIHDLFFQLLLKSAVQRQIVASKIVSLWEKKKNYQSLFVEIYQDSLT